MKSLLTSLHKVRYKAHRIITVINICDTDQQLLMAFAIPPRAWINPGPETTRQTPGLQTNIKKFIVHCSKDGVSENDLHINPIKYQGKNKKKNDREGNKKVVDQRLVTRR